MAVIGIRCTESEKNTTMFLAERKKVSVSELVRRKLATAYSDSKMGNFKCPEIDERYFAEEKKTEILHSRVPDHVWYWVNMTANCNEISVSSLAKYIVLYL